MAKYMEDTISYKFVKWDISPLATYKKERLYILAKKLHDGKITTREDKNSVT